jgi:hypothetical protein
MILLELQLCRVFDGNDALLLLNETGENIQERRLA